MELSFLNHFQNLDPFEPTALSVFQSFLPEKEQLKMITTAIYPSAIFFFPADSLHGLKCEKRNEKEFIPIVNV